MKRIIAHVDMDAFFASVEQLVHPEWKGKPLVVGSDPKKGKGRGVVSAASYEAREYGIHSAMPVSRAYKLCPHAIFVQGGMGIYKSYSDKIFEVFYQLTPTVEPISIDEAFLDMTGLTYFYSGLEEMGKTIKQEIFNKTGLIASVGIAPVKSVSKIASDLKKPDGLVIVEKDGVLDFLRPLHIKRLWGVGEKTEVKLKKMGINTFGELWDIPLTSLKSIFGKMGEHLYYISRGEDKRPVAPYEEVKSISNEHTFNTDTFDVGLLKKTLLQLSVKVAERMRKKQFVASTLTIKIRFSDFNTITRRKSLIHVLKDSSHIYKYAEEILLEEIKEKKAVRLIGVGVANLKSAKEGLQLSLFDEIGSNAEKIDKATETVNKKFGKGIIKRAELINRGKTKIKD